MLARFLVALSTAAVVAALFAGAATSAQAPAAGQAPAAAADQKKPKTPKAWPPDAATLEKNRLEAEALPLFQGEEPVEFVLTADWKAVQRDRKVESKKLYPGTLAIVKDGVAGTPSSSAHRSPGTCGPGPGTRSPRRWRR